MSNKKIYINENRLKALVESHEEITFFSFFNNIRNFLKDLLNDPINAEPSDELKRYFNNATRGGIIDKLVGSDIVRRNTKLKETPKQATENGKSQVNFSIKYSVPRDNFKEKIHNLYNKTINEAKSFFKDEDDMKKQILDGEDGETYKQRGGIKPLNEYLDKYYGNQLKKYLKQSQNNDEFNQDEMIQYNDNWTFFYKFINQKYDYEFDEEELQEIKECCDDYDEALLEDIIDGKYKEYKKEFAEWLEYYNSYSYIPTSSVMDYTKDINNGWLIHFSDNAWEIWQEGFQYATYDIEKLGYSNAGSTKGKQNEGFNFAYNAESNFVKHAFVRGEPKYGKEAVMFRASGVQATHFGDEEEQVMFYNKDAKDIVYIQYSYVENERSCGDEWCLFGNNGQIVYHNEDIDEVVCWVMRNFDQYRKQLVNPKQHKIIQNSNANSTYSRMLQQKGNNNLKNNSNINENNFTNHKRGNKQIPQ